MKLDLSDMEKVLLGFWVISILISNRVIGFVLFIAVVLIALFKLEDSILGIFRSAEDDLVEEEPMMKTKIPLRAEVPFSEDTDELLQDLVKDFEGDDREER